MKDIYIYTLSDPTNNEIRYIGQAVDMEDRLSRHLSTYNLQNSTKKNNWIVSLYQKGVVPVMELLDIGNTNNVDDLEKYWIAQFRNWGFRLTNDTEGGDGGPDWTGKKHREDSIMKMRINHPLRKCVGKFNKDGNLLDRYLSRHEAAKQNSFDRSHITKCCEGKQKTCGGFIWKYIPDFSNEVLIAEPIKVRNLSIKMPKNSIIKSFDTRKIIQYDLEGNILGIFKNKRQAKISTGICDRSIYRCVIYKSIHSCFIKGTKNKCTFRYDNEEFDYANYHRFIPKENMFIVKFDLDINYINHYKSIGDAAKENNLRFGNLESQLSLSVFTERDNKLRQCGGFHYRILSKEEVEKYKFTQLS